MSEDEKIVNEEVVASLEAEFDKLNETTDDTSVESGRDEKGRFKAKETETAAVEEPPAEITDQGTEPTPEPAEQPLSAPDRWSAEWKTKFTTLPRDAQQVLLDRESEYDKGFTQKSQEAADYKRRYEPIDQILTPRRQQFAMQGMTEEQGLTQLFALSDFAANDPQGFIRMFAQGRGIDLASLTPGTQPTAPSEFTPILQKVNTLEQTIHSHQQAETNRQIQAFKSAPGHEHFESVRNDMGGLLKAGLATDMQDAYDRACRVNPTVFAQIETAKQVEQEAKRKEVEAKRIADAKAAAQKAQKSAGTQLSTKASLNGGVPAPSSMLESMTREYDRLHGAA